MRVNLLACRLTLICSTLFIGGCGLSVRPAAEGLTPQSTSLVLDMSDPALVRDQVLAYIRICYAQEAPPPDLTWTEERATSPGLAGRPINRYRAADWVISVSSEAAMPPSTIYQVVVVNQATGFRWEGQVDAKGEVIGQALQLTPPAKATQDPYPGWSTYLDVDHRFSFRYPPSWKLEEMPGCDQEAHSDIVPSVKLTQDNLALFIGCERARQGIVIHGASGEGEWHRSGTVRFMGQTASRMVLIYEARDKAVYYNGTAGIQVDNLTFYIALVDQSADYSSIDIPKELQTAADQIVESFEQVAIRYCNNVGA
jgi:hypothetical protein